MSIAESWRDKTFLISDAKALIRNDNLLGFATVEPGKVVPPGLEQIGPNLRIPRNTRVRVTDVKIMPAAGKSRQIFARTTSEDGATFLGWTFSQNFEDKFVNETMGSVPKGAADDRFGAAAAWSGGNYLGQVELVGIVDSEFHIEKMSLPMTTPYFAMVGAARADKIFISINSGFRSFPEQDALFKAFKANPAQNPEAAEPGKSKHQNGIALDINVGGATGDPVYDWLALNATSFGFVRTVNNEPWHWEHDPARATAAKIAGKFKTPNVVDTKFA
ncbi:MAG TPA: M15 family metallopeptidase [Reyranella sp.]|nr:M15 family metallopeptidase [Reyranella sp.]